MEKCQAILTVGGYPSRAAYGAIPRPIPAVERRSSFVFASSVLTISVIIPTLNEASTIRDVISGIPASTSDEIVVVDGGSIDETVNFAEDAGCRVFISPEAGRALQLNLGAFESSGDILLFLHADTFLSGKAVENARAILESRPEIVGGGFQRRFASPSGFLEVTSRLADWRGRWWGWFLGDQGIFVRRGVFDELGGFDAHFGPGEDLDFSVRMSAFGKTCIAGPPVVSSPRRFARKGVLRQTLNDFRAGWSMVNRAKKKIRG